MTTLEGRFNGERNGLNGLRLLLALSVIVWHTFPLGGFTLEARTQRGVSTFGVDAFFVISGVLITRSWVRRPKLVRYAWHRALRILPAFWVCLVVTAGALAPIGFVGGQGNELADYPHRSALDYVLKNKLLTMHQYDITGTLQGLPFPVAWDGSLYTLRYEAACYIGIAVLGVVGLLRLRATAPLIFLAGWGLYLLIDFDKITVTAIHEEFGRFALCFAAGAALFALWDKIPGSGWLAGCCAVIVLGSYLSEHSRALAIVPFAYLVLWVGLHLHWQIHRDWDISYGVYIYGFAVQQVFASYGLNDFSFTLYLLSSVAVTLVLAVASCRLVEVPALRLREFSPGEWRQARRKVA